METWAATSLEALKTADLQPYAANARTHSEEQVAQIAASIREFGFTNPVLVDAAGVLVAGHGRVMAAKLLGLATVPVIRLGHLTDVQARAYRIADNKLALNSGWDEALLAVELADLNMDGFDLALSGFGDKELAQMFAPDTDAAAEWQGMPEFEQSAQKAFRSVIVHFRDAEAVETFCRALALMSLSEKAKFISFPAEARADLEALRYEVA